MLKLGIFAVASAGILAASWESLHDPRQHGFFRFFAFESILLLVLLNAGRWFQDPFSAPQSVSWILLTASLLLAIHGFTLLHTIGRPQGHVEQTTTLVRQGAYRYVRHPLYASLLLLAWGAFLKAPSLAGGSLAAAATAFLYATARVEEAENLSKFGDAYAEYMQRTTMFFPLLF